MANDSSPVVLTHSEAILAVSDVLDTIRFYREVLGFQDQWVWGEPPSFGGVHWGRQGLMFSLQPELAARVEGHEHYFFVTGIDALYASLQGKKATIVEPLREEPWGLREFAVRDPNGYCLRFGEPRTPPESSGKAKPLPEGVRIAERLPTEAEYLRLVEAVGWTRYINKGAVADAMAKTVYGLVAEKAGVAIGAARLVGDGALAYYVQDVMVAPEHQKQGIGSALVEALMWYFRTQAPARATIALFTSRPLRPFYERVGFEGPETSLYGMYQKKWD